MHVSFLATVLQDLLYTYLLKNGSVFCKIQKSIVKNCLFMRRFECLPVQLRTALQNKNKKKSKKLPMHCVFCKVQWIIPNRISSKNRTRVSVRKFKSDSNKNLFFKKRHVRRLMFKERPHRTLRLVWTNVPTPKKAMVRKRILVRPRKRKGGDH